MLERMLTTFDFVRFPRQGFRIIPRVGPMFHMFDINITTNREFANPFGDFADFKSFEAPVAPELIAIQNKYKKGITPRNLEEHLRNWPNGVLEEWMQSEHDLFFIKTELHHDPAPMSDTMIISGYGRAINPNQNNHIKNHQEALLMHKMEQNI